METRLRMKFRPTPIFSIRLTSSKVLELSSLTLNSRNLNLASIAKSKKVWSSAISNSKNSTSSIENTRRSISASIAILCPNSTVLLRIQSPVRSAILGSREAARCQEYLFK